MPSSQSLPCRVSTPSGRVTPRRRSSQPARSSASGSCHGHLSVRASSPARSVAASRSPTTTSAAGFPRFTREALEANQPIVDLVTEIAARKDVTRGQIALAWLLAKSPSIVPIPGSRRTERVTENIKAADITLTATEVEEVDARSAHLSVTGARGSGHESYRWQLAIEWGDRQCQPSTSPKPPSPTEPQRGTSRHTQAPARNGVLANGFHADGSQNDLVSPSSRDTSWIGHEFDRRAASYDDSELHRWQADQAVQLLQPQPAQRILDIATGTGLAARACARITHAPQLIVGIDVSHGMLRAAASVSTSSYLQADATQLPFRPATFDALLCVAAIPYLPDLAKAVSEWRRVAQPSANLAFTTPAANGIATLRLIRQAAADHGLAVPDHASLSTTDQITDTLDNLGLLYGRSKSAPSQILSTPIPAWPMTTRSNTASSTSSAMPHRELPTLSTTATSPPIVSSKLPARPNMSPCSRGALSRANRDTRRELWLTVLCSRRRPGGRRRRRDWRPFR
jgi:SAM-dependent methyltransferase